MTGTSGTTGLWRISDIENPRQISYKLEDDDQCIQERIGFTD
jgi:hypothetical protein